MSCFFFFFSLAGVTIQGRMSKSKFLQQKVYKMANWSEGSPHSYFHIRTQWIINVSWGSCFVSFCCFWDRKKRVKPKESHLSFSDTVRLFKRNLYNSVLIWFFDVPGYKTNKRFVFFVFLCEKKTKKLTPMEFSLCFFSRYCEIRLFFKKTIPWRVELFLLFLSPEGDSDSCCSRLV